jgi:hypothetical protein
MRHQMYQSAPHCIHALFVSNRQFERILCKNIQNAKCLCTNNTDGIPTMLHSDHIPTDVYSTQWHILQHLRCSCIICCNNPHCSVSIFIAIAPHQVTQSLHHVTALLYKAVIGHCDLVATHKHQIIDTPRDTSRHKRPSQLVHDACTSLTPPHIITTLNHITLHSLLHQHTYHHYICVAF